MPKNVLTDWLPSQPVGAPPTVQNPELVFGIVGPIGVDLDGVIKSLTERLKQVNYAPQVIHLTDLMEDDRIAESIDKTSYYKKYTSLIKYANAFREIADEKAALAGLAVFEIRRIREQKTKDPDRPALGTAYIIRQFKRPEEIDLMRKVYGRKFIQISVYGSPNERRKKLIEKIKSYDLSPKNDTNVESEAIHLIDIDHNQVDDENGQRLSDVFHLGDVFVDGIDASKADQTLQAFVKAFFGFNGASPTKDEYGLYTATAAALRSIDLSRQVGAAIFSSRGEVISLGCNEVPKAGGGTYWVDGEGEKFRDFEKGSDPNQKRRDEIIYDFVERMSKEQLLSTALKKLPDVKSRVDAIMGRRPVKEAQIMDIIEYGRIIHAEMSAITDAARLGKGIQDGTLYCTTFPCHLCAKHIVASGIRRVVFLEPYPKSYAQELHGDSITFEKDESQKVLFEPFMGISPRRYRDIFEKKKRKYSDGKAREWWLDIPSPMLEDKGPTYLENEMPYIYVALRNLGNATKTE
ncbi:deaminase [Methylobacterium currus]|uniref:anti-phage dCTP deaminase n=1 Tax=Methylobacterium currus TaxID=2051553 RepID=UPI001E5FB89A|nr:anti-phage dCTP deaminase [Methylobacterium currus]UHC14452.1 deaminase [Methylobacterium currus]